MTTTECTELEASLVDLLDGKLAPQTALRLRVHADGCTACAISMGKWQRALPAMRKLAPSPPTPLALRRMELAIARGLEAEVPPRSRFRLPRFRWSFVAVAACACAALVAGYRWLPDADDGYGRLEAYEPGGLLIDGQAVGSKAVLASGSRLTVAGPHPIAMRLGREIAARLDGPGQLVLAGDARAVRVVLDSGELGIELSSRQAGESFAVETRHGRVEVRGTRFSVGFAGQGAWVRVTQGRVAVFRAGDAVPHPVEAGQTFWLAPESPPAPPSLAPVEPASVPDTAASGAAPPSDCGTVAARARRAMRAGQPARALSLLSEGAPAGAGLQGSQRCRDEIGYLHAEALRASGRVREAIAAYLRLDRRGAEPAMRQNALFAAGELEERAGRQRAAYQRFEGALVVAPAGGLREEAMAGAVRTAFAAGDGKRARAAALRYLAAYPDGASAARARQIVEETATGPRR